MTSTARDVFFVCPAADLDPQRHAVLALPTEGGKNSHRVPIRAAADNGTTPFIPGKQRVTQSAAGLRRLLVRFPESYCHSIKEFTEGDRVNLSLGFALFDPRSGATPEEDRVMRSIDAFTDWVRTTMVGCERIRTAVNLGPVGMSEAKQQTKADCMDLCVSRSVAESSTVHPVGADPPRPHGRYCYVKLTPPSPTVSDLFVTYWWSPNGSPMTLDTVRRMQNFRIEPFVEMEDVFCSVPVPVTPLPFTKKFKLHTRGVL